MYGSPPASPVSCLADLVITVLERGIVVVLRLEGEPGDRRLAVGVGLPESANSLLFALTAAQVIRSRGDDWDEQWDDTFE